MILDNHLKLSDEQAVTTSAASTNYIDQGAADQAINPGMWLVIQTPEAVTSTGAATVTFSLQTDDNTSFGSASTVFVSNAIAKASLTINSEPVKVKLPLGLERYLRVYYTCGDTLSAGKFDAFLVSDIEQRS